MLKKLLKYDLQIINSNPNAYLIVDVIVRPEYQGQGIGRKLYDTVCEANTDNFFTANASPYAKEIYEHMGFECQQEMQQVNGIKFYPMKGIIKTKNISR